MATMTLRTSGNRQSSVWASIVSEQALALRDWLLGLGFTEDLMIPGEEDGLTPSLPAGLAGGRSRSPVQHRRAHHTLSTRDQLAACRHR